MTAMMVGGRGTLGGVMGMGRKSLSPPTTTPAPHAQRLPSPHSPPSPVSSDPPTSPSSPGRSGGGSKACGVCGDVAKSMHFGGLSCDSCKAFFRRSVQNNAYKGFTCPYEKKCVIAVASRKACQYCRFHKCLAIGMEKGWVMSEDERRKMMQQRQEKKTKAESMKPSNAAEADKYVLSNEDRTEISIIVSLYKKAYQDVPYEENTQMDGPSGVMSPWMTFCKRIGYFFSLFREFTELPSSDQALLLKTAITSACIIMGSVVYDSDTGRWPGKPISRSGFIPNVTSQNVERLVPAELMSRVEQFFRKFQQVCPDETMAMILILVALYSPELMGLEARDTIQGLQDRYTHVLHRYVKWKYRERSGLMFPKVIVSLADIRELAERTAQMRIQQGVASNIPSISQFMQKPSSSSQSSEPSPMETNQTRATFPKPSPMEGVQIKQECELESECALQTEAAHKRARLEATGGARDHTYQKIMQKVMDQMHNSSIHMRIPSLLPFIIQIVKKIGAGNGSGSTTDTTGSTTNSHVSKTQHHQSKQHRSGSKRRLMEVKQERDDDMVDFKEEHVDDTCEMQVSPEISQMSISPISSNLHHNTHSNLQSQFDQNQTLQQTSQLPQAQHIQQINHPQITPSSPGILVGIEYSGSHADSTNPCDMLPPSPLHASNSRMSPHLAPSPLPSHQSSNMHLSPQISQMSPVAPYTPPSAVASSPMPVQQSNMLPVVDMPLPSPMTAPSPYSDTSSSSPESSQSPFSELFSEELSDVEIDVLTQLLEYVSTFQNFENIDLDNVSNIRELLPPDLLSELQTKLGSYSLKHE